MIQSDTSDSFFKKCKKCFRIREARSNAKRGFYKNTSKYNRVYCGCCGCCAASAAADDSDE